MSDLELVLAGVVAALVVAMPWRRLRGPRRVTASGRSRRILVPFVGELYPTVLAAAIRIAKAENAVLVPAYLLIVPLGLPEESPLKGEVEVALPLLEAVEHAALKEGVPVDARVEKGRSLTHALHGCGRSRLRPCRRTCADHESVGFTPKDLIWILANAPAETVILRPQHRTGTFRTRCCGSNGRAWPRVELDVPGSRGAGLPTEPGSPTPARRLDPPGRGAGEHVRQRRHRAVPRHLPAQRPRDLARGRGPRSSRRTRSPRSPASSAARSRTGSARARPERRAVLMAVAIALFPLIHGAWQAFVLTILVGPGSGSFWPSQSTLLSALTPAGGGTPPSRQQRMTMNLGVALGGLVGGLDRSPACPDLHLPLPLDAATFLAYARAPALIPSPPRVAPRTRPAPTRRRSATAPS